MVSVILEMWNLKGIFFFHFWCLYSVHTLLYLKNVVYGLNFCSFLCGRKTHSTLQFTINTTCVGFHKLMIFLNFFCSLWSCVVQLRCGLFHFFLDISCRKTCIYYQKANLYYSLTFLRTISKSSCKKGTIPSQNSYKKLYHFFKNVLIDKKI